MGHVEAGLPGAIISLQTTKRFPFQPTADLKNSFAKNIPLNSLRVRDFFPVPLRKSLPKQQNQKTDLISPPFRM